MAAVITQDCPRCGTKRAAMRFHDPGVRVGEQDYRDVWDALATCLVCERSVVATVSVQGRLSDAKAREIHVLAMEPRPQDTAAPKYTPENVDRFYRQGMENVSKNWDAAGTMFRRALDAGLKKRWPDEQGSLFARIDKVSEQGGLTPDMKEWAHQIRLIGNDAAHEEAPIDRRQAEDIATFTRLFLLYTFTLPGMLAAAQGAEGAADAQDGF